MWKGFLKYSEPHSLGQAGQQDIWKSHWYQNILLLLLSILHSVIVNLRQRCRIVVWRPARRSWPQSPRVRCRPSSLRRRRRRRWTRSSPSRRRRRCAAKRSLPWARPLGIHHSLEWSWNNVDTIQSRKIFSLGCVKTPLTQLQWRLRSDFTHPNNNFTEPCTCSNWARASESTPLQFGSSTNWRVLELVVVQSSVISFHSCIHVICKLLMREVNNMQFFTKKWCMDVWYGKTWMKIADVFGKELKKESQFLNFWSWQHSTPSKIGIWRKLSTQESFTH